MVWPASAAAIPARIFLIRRLSDKISSVSSSPSMSSRLMIIATGRPLRVIVTRSCSRSTRSTTSESLALAEARGMVSIDQNCSLLWDRGSTSSLIERTAGLREQVGRLTQQRVRLHAVPLRGAERGAGFPNRRLPRATGPHAGQPLGVAEPEAGPRELPCLRPRDRPGHAHAQRARTADLFGPRHLGF